MSDKEFDSKRPLAPQLEGRILSGNDAVSLNLLLKEVARRLDKLDNGLYGLARRLINVDHELERADMRASYRPTEAIYSITPESEHYIAGRGKVFVVVYKDDMPKFRSGDRIWVDETLWEVVGVELRGPMEPGAHVGLVVKEVLQPKDCEDE